MGKQITIYHILGIRHIVQCCLSNAIIWHISVHCLPQFYILKYSFCVVVEEPSEDKESEELDLTGLDDAELDKV